jgi:hypothetical protein
MIGWADSAILLRYIIKSRSLELSCVVCSALGAIKLVILALEYLLHVNPSRCT